MAILTDAELNDIIDDIGDIITDDSISTTIRYNLAGTTVSTWNPTTATIPAMYAVSSVSAFKGTYTLEEVEQSGGLIEIGDVKIIMMTSSVSGTLSVDDRVAESATSFASATTYQIVQKSIDPLGICYFFQCRSI